MTSDDRAGHHDGAPLPSMAGSIAAALLGLMVVKLLVVREPVKHRSFNGSAAGERGGAADRGFSQKEHTEPHVAATEPGRGRHAESPQNIPALGWRDILWRTCEEFGQDRIMSVAAGVTYYALLAIFPAVAALVSIYGLFADPVSLREDLAALSSVLPGGAIEIIGDQVSRIASQGNATLGLSFVVGLGLALWSANAGMKAIFDALNIVYDEEEKRGFVKLNALSLLFTLGAIAFLLVAMGAVVILPILLEYIGLKNSTEWLIAIARWPLLLLGVVAGLAVLYRWGPSRDKAQWKWVTPGGVVAAVLWLTMSMLFSWYVSAFGNYNETYGSLGAVIGFMTWIWISAIVVLLGAEINAETEHQTLKDTTEGPQQPLGSRGAQMADTVGVSKA